VAAPFPRSKGGAISGSFMIPLELESLGGRIGSHWSLPLKKQRWLFIMSRCPYVKTSAGIDRIDPSIHWDGG
jgi:hypothetical protein